MNEFERNTFGVSNGQRGVDAETISNTLYQYGAGGYGLGSYGLGEGSLIRTEAPARDEVGNGHKLTKFRGRFMTPWFKTHILRTEDADRRSNRMRRTDSFLKRGMSTTIN